MNLDLERQKAEDRQARQARLAKLQKSGRYFVARARKSIQVAGINITIQPPNSACKRELDNAVVGSSTESGGKVFTVRTGDMKYIRLKHQIVEWNLKDAKGNIAAINEATFDDMEPDLLEEIDDMIQESYSKDLSEEEQEKLEGNSSS